jgi:hypothetical protein
MPRLRFHRVIHSGFTSAGHIVYIHTQRMTNPMREERAADAAGKDRLFCVPGATAWGVRGLEDPETLESFDEGAMTEELNGVPV